MANRIPLLITRLSGVIYGSVLDEFVDLDSIVKNSPLDKITSKINKPFKLFRIYDGNTVGYYAEFENELDALEYSLKLEPIHYGFNDRF